MNKTELKALSKLTKDELIKKIGSCLVVNKSLTKQIDKLEAVVSGLRLELDVAKARPVVEGATCHVLTEGFEKPEDVVYVQQYGRAARTTQAPANELVVEQEHVTKAPSSVWEF